MGITKNKQSQGNIRGMAKAAFPQKEMVSCEELTEGMCNAAYLVQFSDGSRSVLKIASDNREGFMSNEVHLMDAEVKAMRLVGKSGLIRVANVEYYDTSKTLCDGKYFFMEALDGKSYFSIGEQLSDAEKSRINFNVGQVQKRLETIQGKNFGLLGDEEHQYDNLFDFVYHLISNVLADAGKKDIVIGVSDREILSGLETHRRVFEEVAQPTLVHWDMWEGNIFIKDKQISGIIDWERAMWGEAFMDDRFRRHTRNEDFLKGFGKTTFTQEEWCRIGWYDVLLYLTMMTEGAYRGYEDDGQYRWVKPLFEASWSELQQMG
uniref:phosphotransferase family protein n=1 Tax=Acetatifactor sp. TaxID=1872090 RepID=UPI00405627CD